MLVLMALTLLSRFIGLGREMALAYFYGASRASDAFLIAQSVPTLFMGFLLAGISSGFIPIYRQEELDQRHQRFSRQVFWLTGLMSLVVFLATMLVLPVILRVLAGGFDEASMDLALRFSRITLWGVFFIGWSRYFSTWLQVREQVILASLVGIPFNIVIISAIFWSSGHSVYGLAFGSVAAVAAQCLYLWLLAKKGGHSIGAGGAASRDFQGLRRMLFMALPVIIGDSVQQLDIIVDKSLGSTFGTGSVSALVYAGRAMTAVEGIFITSVITVFFPAIARLAAAKEIDGVKAELRESILGVCLFLVPAVFGIMALSGPITSLLFLRGAFGEEEAAVTAGIMFFYIAALLGTGLQTLFSRVFFSLGNTRIPMVAAIISVALNITLNLLFARLIGLVGLAMSNTLSAFIGLALMVYFLKKELGELGFSALLAPLAKVLGASGLMAFAASVLYNGLAGGSLLVAVGASALVAGVIYLILVIALKAVDPKKLLPRLKSKPK